MNLKHKLRVAAHLMSKHGFPTLASWVMEADEVIRHEEDGHKRLCDTVAIHHKNFDEIYERAVQEAKRPSSLSHKAFADWIISVTHPEADMR